MTDKNKCERISSCLDQREVDLWQLRELALSDGGLVNSATRRRAWAKLVGVSCLSSMTDDDIPLEELCQKFEKSVSIQKQEELNMIDRDSGRSVFMRYLIFRSDRKLTRTGSNLSQSSSKNDDPQIPNDDDCSTENDTIGMQESNLAYVLKSITSESDINSPDHLYYYQGFHDVAAVFLLNLENPELVSTILTKVCKSHFRDAMRQDFSKLSSMLRIVFFPLIHALDREIHEQMVVSEIDETVVFPWIISWFSHDIHDPEISSRLFDFFLVSHPLMPLYLSIAIIIHSKSRDQILNSDEDPASMHMAITGLLQQLSTGKIGNGRVSPSLESLSTQSTIETCEDHLAGSTSSGYNTEEIVLNIQDLIDEAIGIIEKYPPAALISLSKRYHRDMDQEQPSLESFTSIEMLKVAPSWSLVSKLPADWVLRQRRRSKFKKVKPLQNLSVKKKTPKKKSDQLPKSKIACGMSSVKDFTMDSSEHSKLSSSLFAKVKSSHSTIVDAYMHFTNILVLGRRKRITKR